MVECVCGLLLSQTLCCYLFGHGACNCAFNFSNLHSLLQIELIPSFNKYNLCIYDCLTWKNTILFTNLWHNMHIDGFMFMGNRFEVESAPAIVFVKDSGVKPVVVHGMSFFDFHTWFRYL